MTRPAAVAVVLAAALTSGCVERRFVIETSVPGALVTVNNQPIGPGPADTRWEYWGQYEVRAVAPGYEPARAVIDVKPRWYEVPPLDFVAEALWPWHIEDVRRYRVELKPSGPVNTDELLQQAGELRTSGRELPYREPKPK